MRLPSSAKKTDLEQPILRQAGFGLPAESLVSVQPVTTAARRTFRSVRVRRPMSRSSQENSETTRTRFCSDPEQHLALAPGLGRLSNRLANLVQGKCLAHFRVQDAGFEELVDLPHQPPFRQQ